MTTESPITVDGSQCVAAANYWNPATALYGPQGSGQYLLMYISSSRTVTLQTTSGGQCYGVLQNAPVLGGAASIAIAGITKVVAGAAISAGAELQSDTNGRAITQTSTNRKVGMALEAATAAGQIIAMLVYTPNG